MSAVETKACSRNFIVTEKSTLCKECDGTEMKNELKIHIIVPTHFSGTGTLCSTGFSVQSILADQNIHRRRLRVESLERAFSVKYINKNLVDFLSFVLSDFCEFLFY